MRPVAAPPVAGRRCPMAWRRAGRARPGRRGTSLRIARDRWDRIALSWQRIDQLLDRDPGAGEERYLFAGVPPRIGGPQFAHQVDDAMQLRCLECQQPLVVAERECG